MKTVYQAVNKESAEDALEKLNDKWGALYPIVIKSWRDNWDNLSEYFRHTAPIRKLIYTTNTLEGYHRQSSMFFYNCIIYYFIRMHFQQRVKVKKYKQEEHCKTSLAILF